jgi:hypothetical protein
MRELLNSDSHARQKRTEFIVHLFSTSSASSRGSDFAVFAAKPGSSKKPRSFSGIEAETMFAKPLFANKRSYANSLFVYLALFANPVESIFDTSLFSSNF